MKLQHLDGRNIDRTRFSLRRNWSFIFVVIWGGLSTYLVWWSYHFNEHQYSLNMPLIEATAEIQSSVAGAHLWFEEYLAGDSSISQQEILRYHSNARKQAEAIRGYRSQHGDTDSTYHYESITVLTQFLLASIDRLDSLMVVRAEHAETSGIGSALDAQYDLIHKGLNDSCEVLATHITTHVNAEISYGQAVFRAVIVAWVILLFVSAAIMLIRQEAERKSREDAKKSQNKFRKLFEQSNEATIINRLDGSIIDANQRACHILDRQRESLLSSNIFDLILLQDADEKRRTLTALRTIGWARWETCFEDGAGGLTYADVNSTIIDRNSGEVQTLIRDVTDQKRAKTSHTALLKIYEASSQTRSLHDLLAMAQIELGELVDTSNFSVVLYDEQQDIYTFPYSADEFDAADEHRPVKLRKSLTDYVRRTRQPLLVNEEEYGALMADGEVAMVGTPSKIWMGIPLISASTCLGVMVLQSYTDANALSLSDLELMTLVSEPITGVIERKQAEANIRDAKDLLHSTIESTSDGILVINHSGSVVYSNSRFGEIWRVPTPVLRSKSRGRLLKHILSQLEDPERFVDRVRRISNVEDELNDSWTLKDGRTVDRFSTPLVQDGRVAGRVWSYRDVTERIQHSTEMKKLSAVVNQSANLICITDTSGAIEYVNPEFARSTGHSLVDAIGKRPNLLKSGKHDNQFYNDLWKTITGGKSWSGNIQNKRRNGELYWEQKTISPIMNDEGEIISFLSIGQDITREIYTQQQLVASDKLSAIGTLAAGVAHEFKNYLGGIIGNASYALSDLDHPGGLDLARETLEQIVDMGEKANDVAMALLTYSKASPEEVKPEDLKTIIAKSLSLVEKEMATHNIEVATYFEDIPPVAVSASKIQQLLLNLLINARHAIDRAGVITISLTNWGNSVALCLADTGKGIPDNLQERIFDPFFSTKGVWGKDEISGTGMGLSICRNIAKEYGGDLIVDSIEEVGTRFTLLLPTVASNSSPSTNSPSAEIHPRIMIFSLDKSIVKRYHEEASRHHTEIRYVDNIDNIHFPINQIADLVICDARFCGKVELTRMIDLCRKERVPYILIQCRAMEQPLGDIYDHSLGNFKEEPAFSRLWELYRGVNAEVTDLPAT